MDKNMDIKDLFKKFKSGSGKDARKGAALNNFFEKNPKMKIILPAIFITIALAVAVGIILSGAKTDIDLDENVTVAGQAVEVLPQVVREDTEAIEEGVDPFAEDVIANAVLTGLTYNSDGYYTAVVQTKAASYVLQVGDNVGDSDWVVDAIDDSSITFSIGEKTRTISMK